MDQGVEEVGGEGHPAVHGCGGRAVGARAAPAACCMQLGGQIGGEPGFGEGEGSVLTDSPGNM